VAELPRSPRPSRPLIAVVSVATALVVVAVVVALAEAPAPTSSQASFSGQVKTAGNFPCSACRATTVQEYLPPHTNVTLQWSDTTRGVVKFGWWIGNSSYTWCAPAGRAGSCYLNAYGGNYTFGAVDASSYQPAQTVEFAGFYTP
jgi:hypothetical protein